MNDNNVAKFLLINFLLYGSIKSKLCNKLNIIKNNINLVLPGSVLKL